ncbi:MAG TPA: hypothetical protein VK586_22015 [Streptosporangiaceae bacterium]|nr:hypothetical protein [Streptosporangiaceae bacterium]
MRLLPARVLARAALIGATTGSRSFTGMAALALATPASAATQPDRTLRKGWVKALVASGALGELGADKLPATPDRLAPRGLTGRVLMAALTGQTVARRQWPPRPGDPGPADPDPVGEAAAATAAAVAVGTALAAAWLGSRWRRVAARHLGRDWPGAVLEDAAALSLAWAAVRS